MTQYNKKKPEKMKERQIDTRTKSSSIEIETETVYLTHAFVTGKLQLVRLIACSPFFNIDMDARTLCSQQAFQ